MIKNGTVIKVSAANSEDPQFTFRVWGVTANRMIVKGFVYNEKGEKLGESMFVRMEDVHWLYREPTVFIGDIIPE